MPSDLESVVADVVSGLTEQARANDVRLESDVAPGLFAALDQQVLRSILATVAAQALGSVSPGGWVRISAQPERDEALIAIKDSGDGLSRDPGWAAAAVQSNRGRLWCNRARGKGSTCYVALPRARPTRRPRASAR